MINAWSLLYDEINGTNVMSDETKIETSKDEGVVNVPSDINLDTYEHSNAWYDYIVMIQIEKIRLLMHSII